LLGSTGLPLERISSLAMYSTRKIHTDIWTKGDFTSGNLSKKMGSGRSFPIN
jgi:hypothetical protein